VASLASIPCIDPASAARGATHEEHGRAGTAQVSLPREWFERHFDRLWRLVSRLGVSAAHAEDLVQEAFIIAARRREAIAAGTEGRYLAAVAVRLCANHRRRAFVRYERALPEGPEHAASQQLDGEQALALKRRQLQLNEVLTALSDTNREVFVLYELERFELSEIAELLDVPVGTVKSRLLRARAHFSELVHALQRSAKLEESL
jgi:RNA polymerase sigma-70 factor, ECF subfamily